MNAHRLQWSFVVPSRFFRIGNFFRVVRIMFHDRFRTSIRDDSAKGAVMAEDKLLQQKEALERMKG